VKEPQTWAEFLGAAEDEAAGALCGCGSETCMVSIPTKCPKCGGRLELGVHMNAPTLILGCVPCRESFAYLRLERGQKGTPS